MALDPNTQKQISTFINSQFPRLYEEFGQTFIDFVTAYYQWMETEGPLYDSRRASEYQDIDTTADKFLIYFKDKYLPNIQLETNSNVDLLVKHSLDVYRSRGTIRSIDLLFRLVFGTGADVYYPFDDVFQPSSGDWFIPHYIEVSTQDNLGRFVGKEITGTISGATAFVESWVRKRFGTKQIDVLYISAVSGNFVLNEIINTINNPFNPVTCPTMIGSLTAVQVTDGASGFNVGDVVPLIGTKGYSGVGRVANTTQLTGLVNFSLLDGGYAYTANATVLVSQSVLSLQTVVPGANVLNKEHSFKLFETISQPMANINYQSANGGYFVNNDIISTYFGNGTVSGQGIVLAAANGNSTNGQIFVSILSGNLQSNVIYNAGNVISASVPVSNGYNDVTATGNVMSSSFTATLNFNNITGSFIPNETLTTPANNATALLKQLTVAGASGTASIINRTGVWVPGTTVTGVASGATANLVSQNMNIGVINQVGSFLGDVRAPLKTSLSGTTGYLATLNQGSGASFAISNTLLYPESVTLGTDMLAPYVGIQLNAPNYTLPQFPTANLATPLAVALAYSSFTIGRISALTSVSPGTGYTVAPMVRIFEPRTFPVRNLENQLIGITNATSSFLVGDLVTQASTGARALIISSNSSVLIAKKLSLYKTFVPTANSTTTIVSASTGASASITSVDDQILLDPEDLGETMMGLNARISSNTAAASGSIASIQVVDSGWGYEQGETVSITANGVTATGRAILFQQGVGQGFYRTENGFVSDIKKIQDNDYYQVSAYDVRASVTFSRYKDMLKALLHVAGTKAFGTYIHRNEVLSTVNIRKAIITQG